MAFLKRFKRLASLAGLLLFLNLCIIAGVYAARLNTASTLAGWGVGLGVALIEISLIVLLGSKKTQQNLLLAAAMVIAGASPAYYWIAMPHLALKPFKAHLSEYLITASSIQPQYELDSVSQPITGKLMPVDIAAKTIDPVFFDLSSDLRPKNPDEIGAIAAMWWTEEQIGTYGGKGGAYEEHCTVMVLDKATGTLLSHRSFTGSRPPSKSTNGASQTGDKPYKEIREYLNGLPHK